MSLSFLPPFQPSHEISRGAGQDDSIYVWLVNAYVLASTAIEPLYVQLANIFGRRCPMIVAVTLFALGSGIAVGVGSLAMFIAGRLVQGLGARGGGDHAH